MRETWDDLTEDEAALLLAWQDMTEEERDQVWWWITYLQPGKKAEDE